MKENCARFWWWSTSTKTDAVYRTFKKYEINCDSLKFYFYDKKEGKEALEDHYS